MGEFRPPLRSDYPREAGEKWHECVLCGTRRIRGLVHFDGGIAAPSVGETITGATSGDTGVVESLVIIDGEWGDAGSEWADIITEDLGTW